VKKDNDPLASSLFDASTENSIPAEDSNADANRSEPILRIGPNVHITIDPRVKLTIDPSIRVVIDPSAEINGKTGATELPTE
jgi:hypothetical protein